jgi:ABC-type glycerol-3-phosphate transport system permease component
VYFRGRGQHAVQVEEVEAGRVLVYVALSFGVALALAPFVVTTLASFKTTVELVKGPFQPPDVWQWQNYVTAWTDGNLDRFFLNSLVVAVLVVSI